jgi:hypothetical protein
VDLMERAGDLKGMLVDFALSPRFERELSSVVARNFPDGVVTDEALFSTVVDQFALQHVLRSGTTVVEAFTDAHPGLTGDEREMLLGWRDVVEGMFEVTGKDRDAVSLLNLLDELTYRARSNVGGRAFRQLKKDMIVICRLVSVGDDWMISGHMTIPPASLRREMLAMAARQGMSQPGAVFRNPAKLAEARRRLDEQREAFVALFGSDLIVMPGADVPGKVAEFHRHLARQIRPDVDPTEVPVPEFPDRLLADDGVAIHFADGVGLSFYPGYRRLEELFANPELLARHDYRETLSGFLRDPDGSPEPLRRLAAEDPVNASAVFAGLLKRKRGFSWAADGEQLLRQHKPSFFDGTALPRTVVLSKVLSDALQEDG